MLATSHGPRSAQSAATTRLRSTFFATLAISVAWFTRTNCSDAGQNLVRQPGRDAFNAFNFGHQGFRGGLQIARGRGPNGQHRVVSMNGVSIICDMPDETDDALPADQETEDSSGTNRVLNISILEGTIDQFMLGTKVNAETPAVTAERLKELLATEVATIDGVCNLTSEQRSKLTLSGQGDITRFLHRIRSLKASVETVPDIGTVTDFHNWIVPLAAEGEVLGRLFDIGPFGADSLFVKTQKSVLTRKQRAQIAAAAAERTPGFLGEPHRQGQVILKGAIRKGGLARPGEP